MRRLLGAVFGRTESALLAATLATAIVFSLSSPYFLTFSNFVNLIEAYSVTTILAAGVFVVLVSGGIDVSFTATAAATQYVAAYLVVQLGYPAAPALALAAILGVAMGSHQCSAHILSARRLHHRHDRHFERLLRAAHLFHQCGGDLQPARLVVRPYHVPAFRHGLRNREDHSADGCHGCGGSADPISDGLDADGTPSLCARRQSGGGKPGRRRRPSRSVACLRLPRASRRCRRIRSGRSRPPGGSDSNGWAGIECARGCDFRRSQSGWRRRVRSRRCAWLFSFSRCCRTGSIWLAYRRIFSAS